MELFSDVLHWSPLSSLGILLKHSFPQRDSSESCSVLPAEEPHDDKKEQREWRQAEQASHTELCLQTRLQNCVPTSGTSQEPFLSLGPLGAPLRGEF